MMTAKQTRQRRIKIQLLPLNSPLLEMQIIHDHLIVPDTGRAELSPNSQRQPSNTLCPYPSGHPLPLSSLPPPPGLPPRPSILGEDPRPTVNKRILNGPWTGLCLALLQCPFIYTVFNAVCFLVS